ncbi:hypothetical protein V1264_009679 [Littorina saxatilis]|uniref:Uncharacterized protein n=1 Tax=Littorina saxatilis TaxID=31220 RepID=A0AAN9AS99_9CAEN
MTYPYCYSIRPLCYRSQKPTNPPKKEKKGAVPQKTQTKTEAPETLVAMVTPGSAATLHVEDPENRLRVKGGVSQTESRLTLELSGPRSTDAGQYLCHVSVLDSAFLIQDLTAVVNLTIIGKEDSSSLLLAKEKILETQQKHLQDEELAIQEELKHALNDNEDLSQRVHSLEVKNDNLTELVQNLTTMLSLLMSKPETTDDRASLAQQVEENLTGTENSLRDTQAKVDHLENEVVDDLASKLKLLETETLVDISTRLEKIENGAVETHNDGDAESPKSATGYAAKDENFEEELKKLANRLDELEQGKGAVMSREVDQLQQSDLPAVREKLDHMEGDTVKSLEEKITTLLRDQTNTDGEIDKIKTKLTQTEAGLTVTEGERADGWAVERTTQEGLSQTSSTLHVEPTKKENHLNVHEEPSERMSNTSCYVCGDLSRSKPCSVDDLRAAEVQRCPAGAAFCMNDIFQEDHSRKIYKRCVSEAECQREHNADVSEDCAEFSFVSQGVFRCHFCCTSSMCNYDFKPSVGLLRS